MPEQDTLKRGLTLPLMVFYGLGTTIGAGIYALIGKVAGHAGAFVPVSFVLAAALAAFTAFSFAEASSRFPRAAGQAIYVTEGLRLAWLGRIAGLMIAFAGVVSAGALANGAVGYVHEFVAVPRGPVIAVLVLGLGLIAAYGITESVTVAAVFTAIEVGGLLLVIGAGLGAGALAAGPPAVVPPLDAAAWTGIFAGAFLAFYAFLGFEDMVNVAEELRDARRNMPAAIILTLVVTTGLYAAVALVAVSVLPVEELAGSEAPLALVFSRVTGYPPAVISAIGVFAVLNGALIQIIMASRILYGLASRRELPPALARVHPRTRTPLIATALVTGLILALALWFPIEPLARATSALALAVFTLVNLSLVLIKRRDPHPPGARVFPIWLPVLGFFVCLGFLGAEIARWMGA